MNKTVQLKHFHENRQKSVETRESIEFIDNPPSSISNSNPFEVLLHEIIATIKPQHEPWITTNLPTNTRSNASLRFNYDEDTTSTAHEKGLIARLVDEYKEQNYQRERRRMMFCQCVEEIMLDDLETVLKRPASSLDYVDIFKVQH
ncbi:hypothetical protein X798_06455 [Onchocerca flexuosa]|uniref:Uncharacterized protein n=1 Tax=Onchocerca flexuosa TaxID=387005 RepID=A0A238BM84_9BILA|nr:hypothetical protein X798_06455 [Onchocerca flexuosa]